MEFDWTQMNRRTTIALNDAVKVLGFAPDFHIFSDVNIWKRYREMSLDPRTAMVCQRRARDQFIRYERCSFQEQVFHFNHVSKAHQMTEKDDSLYVARTVATGGICLAWKLGAKRVFLMGVDGYKLKDVYYHDGTTKGVERRKERGRADGRITQDRHEWWQQNMRELRDYFQKAGVLLGPWPAAGVYNLSPKSTIDAWEKVDPVVLFKEE